MNKRLVSLDALRGFLIAAMILANNPGSWSYVFDPLEHAVWHGFTITDLIFPGFIFVVGISIGLAYTRMAEKGVTSKKMIQKIGLRAIKLLLLGWWLALWPYFDFENMRIVGVLQRISIAFFVTAILFLYTDWKQQIVWGTGLLLVYFIMMHFMPVPIDDVIAEALVSGQVDYHAGKLDIGPIKKVSAGFIQANYEPGVNLAAYIDRILVPGRFWQVSWDPEGLLSTLPSISNAVFGVLAAHILMMDRKIMEKIAYVMLYGFALYIMGSIWSWFMPLNKNLWTSSFALYTSGLTCMGLGAMMFLADVLGYIKLMRPGIVFGANAISAYVFSSMLSYVFSQKWFSSVSLKEQWMHFFTSIHVEAHLASLFFAVAYVILIYWAMYYLFIRKIFIKV